MRVPGSGRKGRADWQEGVSRAEWVDTRTVVVDVCRIRAGVKGAVVSGDVLARVVAEGGAAPLACGGAGWGAPGSEGGGVALC